MDIEENRKFCLSFPCATKDVKWGSDLAFCDGKKIFAVTGLKTAVQSFLSVKCTPETFAELNEKDDIIPAHYVARYRRVTLQKRDAIDSNEMKDLNKQSYKMVRGKLPQNLKIKLNS